MSCQKVLSMLSAYIDGEVQTSDAEMIKTHLSECDSCAAECKALQAMTGMLRTTPEVEPPAFLLAQIEAATVNRTGFIAKVKRAFDHVPTMARWAAAPVAAAVVLMGILLSNSGDVKAPADGGSPMAQIQKAISDLPGLPNIAVEEQTPSTGAVVAVRPKAKAANWKVHAAKSTKVAKATNGHKTGKPAEIEDQDAGKTTFPEEPKLEEPVVDETEIAENATDLDANETSDTDEAEQTVQVASAPDQKPVAKAVIIAESGSMDQLRAKLAAKSKGRLNNHEDRIEGKKYSVELVSLRF